MNAVTGVGAPWYTSGVHMWNGTAATLKPSPTSRSAKPSEQHAVVRAAWSCARNVGDAGEVRRAGRAVDERDAVEEDRRRERAEQEVLEAGLLRRERGGGRTRRARTARSTGSRATRKTMTRSLAVVISIMPVAEHSISAKYSGAFEAARAAGSSTDSSSASSVATSTTDLDEHREAVDRDHARSIAWYGPSSRARSAHCTPVNTAGGDDAGDRDRAATRRARAGRGGPASAASTISERGREQRDLGRDREPVDRRRARSARRAARDHFAASLAPCSAAMRGRAVTGRRRARLR